MDLGGDTEGHIHRRRDRQSTERGLKVKMSLAKAIKLHYENHCKTNHKKKLCEHLLANQGKMDHMERDKER